MCISNTKVSNNACIQSTLLINTDKFLPDWGCLPWRRGFGIPGNKGLVGGYMPGILHKTLYYIFHLPYLNNIKFQSLNFSLLNQENKIFKRNSTCTKNIWKLCLNQNVVRIWFAFQHSVRPMVRFQKVKQTRGPWA